MLRDTIDLLAGRDKPGRPRLGTKQPLVHRPPTSLVSWLSVSSSTTGLFLAPALLYSCSRSCGMHTNALSGSTPGGAAGQSSHTRSVPAHRFELVHAVGGADRNLKHLVSADEGRQARQRLFACRKGSRSVRMWQMAVRCGLHRSKVLPVVPLLL